MNEEQEIQRRTDYGDIEAARAAIGKYLGFYNTKRPHSSLDRQTPDQVYFNTLQSVPVAA